LKTFDREKKERKGDRPVAIKEKKAFFPKNVLPFHVYKLEFQEKKIHGFSSIAVRNM
jgi:hypothetical protein